MDSGIYRGTNIKKPWLKFYGDIPEFAEIPNLTLYEMLRETALKYPDKTVIKYIGAKISFKKYLSMIDKCAASFIAYGVKAGDSVLLSMPNIPNTMMLFYALNKIGVRVAMTHPLYSSSELSQYIKETNSAWCVHGGYVLRPVQRHSAPPTKNC